MALLKGFQKTKPEGESTSKVLSLLEKSYLSHTDSGDFNTVEDVQGLIDTYKKLPQNIDVQLKIADLENKKIQLGGKLSDILSQKEVFDTQVQDGLDNAARNNFKNMKSLIGSYAAIYADADERYDAEVMSQIFKRYGTTGSIPESTLNYRKTLQEKAQFYAQLYNSYNVQDPVSGEIGLLNPEGIAVQIDTNPIDGSVQHIDIIPSGQIDDKNYMRTEFGLNVISDAPNKKLPTYLRVNDVERSADGKTIRGAMLGNVSYKEKMNSSDNGTETSANILTPAKEKVGFLSKLNVFSDTPSEKLNNSLDSIKENGINFSSGAYKYDSQSVPNDSVLQMGSRLFYSTGKNGQILEIDGKDSNEKSDNLNKYMVGIGKDPKSILPYKITKDYLVTPDGGSRIQGKVDANYFSSPSLPKQSVPIDSGQSVQSNTPEASSTPATTTFFGNRNNPTKPKEPVVSKSTPDIIDQGNSFFRKVGNFINTPLNNNRL